MRKYSESDIFVRMNLGNGIQKQLLEAVRNLGDKVIINNRMKETLDAMNKAYRESITTKVTEAVRNGSIIVIVAPVDKRFPAHIPYLRGKLNGKDRVIVDMSSYAVVKRDDRNNIEELKLDVPKLYNLLVPAYIALEVLNENTVVSTETIKELANLWAKLFNKVLMSQRIFVGNKERYQAFMYFAARFFMIYYMQTPMAIVDNISNQIVGGVKNKYILIVEDNLRQKNIDLYKDWSTFAYTMFSNEITNIQAVTNVDMNVDSYLRLYSNYMGRDGAYLALWSADYFFYCLFVTYNHAWILNDRSWADIVEADPKALPKIMRGLYNEL